MKTSPKGKNTLLAALVCSILALGLGISAAGSKNARGAKLSPPAPDFAFTEDVTIDTGNRPSLTLNQNTTQGFPARAWNIRGDEELFTVNTGFFSYLAIRGDNGNVGLGTTNPGEALHVARSSNPTIRLQQTSASVPRIWNILGNEGGFVIEDRTAGTFPFRINAGTGNVGIGTSVPVGRLHVNGSGPQLSIFQSANNDAVQFRLQTNSINRRFVALNTAGQQQSQLLFGDNGAFDFLGPTASDVRMRFLANGNVGIGTSTPTQKLSVNGTAGKPGGGSWATFSDERLKEIKGEYKSGLDAVMKLTPVRYKYKTDNALGIESDGEHIGFGASAVRVVIPEAVTRDESGYLMIDNDPILWTMLNAIKEQNAQVAQQNAQMKAQSAEIAELKTQNKQIAQLEEQNRQIVEKLERLQAQVVLQAGHGGRPRKAALNDTRR